MDQDAGTQRTAVLQAPPCSSALASALANISIRDLKEERQRLQAQPTTSKQPEARDDEDQDLLHRADQRDQFSRKQDHRQEVAARGSELGALPLAGPSVARGTHDALGLEHHQYDDHAADQHMDRRPRALGQQPKSLSICFDFTKGMCMRGDRCKHSHDLATIVSFNSREKGICFDYLRNQCSRGLLCRFSHDLSNIAQQCQVFNGVGTKGRTNAICYDFVKGVCQRGSECRYSHDLSLIARTARGGGSSGALTGEVCYDYLRGRCSRGSDCKYSHTIAFLGAPDYFSEGMAPSGCGGIGCVGQAGTPPTSEGGALMGLTCDPRVGSGSGFQGTPAGHPRNSMDGNVFRRGPGMQLSDGPLRSGDPQALPPGGHTWGSDGGAAPGAFFPPQQHQQQQPVLVPTPGPMLFSQAQQQAQQPHPYPQASSYPPSRPYQPQLSYSELSYPPPQQGHPQQQHFVGAASVPTTHPPQQMAMHGSYMQQQHGPSSQMHPLSLGASSTAAVPASSEDSSMLALSSVQAAAIFQRLQGLPPAAVHSIMEHVCGKEGAAAGAGQWGAQSRPQHVLPGTGISSGGGGMAPPSLRSSYGGAPPQAFPSEQQLSVSPPVEAPRPPAALPPSLMPLLMEIWNS